MGVVVVVVVVVIFNKHFGAKNTLLKQMVQKLSPDVSIALKNSWQIFRRL